MKKYFRPMLAALLLCAGAVQVHAIPAKKGLLAFHQPDGTTVEVQLIGDEFAHMYLSADGHPLVEREGMFYYATIDDKGALEATNLAVTDGAAPTSAPTRDRIVASLQRQAAQSPLRATGIDTPTGMSRAPQGPGLFPNANFPVVGSPHVLVILAEYSDVKMTLSNAADYFTRMMTQKGFGDYGGTGSAIDYFTEVSSGQFTPIIDVYGPVTLPNTRRYYGQNSGGNDKNAHLMITDACEALDNQVDFSVYDNDNDGKIDNVFVFYAGQGEASYGGADTVWPHSYYVTYKNEYKYVDGVLIDRYACSNEYELGRPDGVGTFIHEFSHVMGLPDLYATDYTSSFTPGAWSALDYGPYNNNGCTPPLYSAFERYAMGWIEPVVIDGPLTASLPSIGENICGIIKTDKANEYFLIENRQRKSWDTYIPGHGMLVWHVDYKGEIWTYNEVNNTPSHQYVDLEEADGTQTEGSRAGDAFPGTENVTSFGDNTKPSMKTWTGKNLGLPITDISEDNWGVIHFNVAGGRAVSDVTPPTAQTAPTVEMASFTARWAPLSSGKALLSVYTKDASNNPNYLPGYYRLNMGDATEASITGLKEDTDYYYIVQAIDGFEVSVASNEIRVHTLRPGIDSYAVVATAADALSDTGFTANWEELPDATSYILTVNAIAYGDPIEETYGFDGSVLPTGWTGDALAFSAMSGRYGKSAPSVTIKPDKYLETRNFGEAFKVVFWHRAVTNSAGTVDVHALVGGEWKTIDSFAKVKDAGGVTCTSTLPAGASTVRIVNNGTGNINVDDVTVHYGATTLRTPVAAFNELNVGNKTAHQVTGLMPGQTYSYLVRATDGQSLSKVSNEVFVTTTGDNSGIGTVETARLTVRVDGRTIAVSGIADDDDVAVYDLTGRAVATAKGSDAITLDAAGVYVVRVASSAVKVVVR